MPTLCFRLLLSHKHKRGYAADAPLFYRPPEGITIALASVGKHSMDGEFGLSNECRRDNPHPWNP